MPRGIIIRDCSSGTGLISAGGNQMEFKLEGTWRSDVAPVTNMIVEFQAVDGKVVSVYAIKEADLAKEQAAQALQVVKEKGTAFATSLTERLGKTVLIATFLVVISWFFLAFIKVQISRTTDIGFTFWQFLGLANGSGGNVIEFIRYGVNFNKGIYGPAALICVFGPFYSQFIKNPYAQLGFTLPLVYMVVVIGLVWFGIHSGAGQATSLASDYFGGGDYAQKFATEMLDEAGKMIHIGIGGYIGFIASAYLFCVGIIKYFASKRIYQYA